MDVDGWGVEAHAGQGHGEGERGGVGTELGIEPTSSQRERSIGQRGTREICSGTRYTGAAPILVL